MKAFLERLRQTLQTLKRADELQFRQVSSRLWDVLNRSDPGSPPRAVRTDLLEVLLECPVTRPQFAGLLSRASLRGGVGDPDAVYPSGEELYAEYRLILNHTPGQPDPTFLDIVAYILDQAEKQQAGIDQPEQEGAL